PRGVMTASPDGSKLLVNDGTVLDGDGKTAGQWDQHVGLNFVWADNSQLCFLTTPQFPAFTGGVVAGDATLEIMALGSAPRAVASVGESDAQGGMRILGCNSATNRSVLTGT